MVGNKNFTVMNYQRIKILTAALLTATTVMTSCSDVKDLDAGMENQDSFTNNGLPVIDAVYDIQDTAFTTPLTDGVLNQYIRLRGKNLAKAKSININGLEVDVRSRVYATSSDSYIRIPRMIPEEETGLLVYETDKGKTEIPFNVTIPTLVLDGLSNEFALQGSRVKLAGEYFDLYEFGDTTEQSPVSIVIFNDEAGYNEEVKLDSCTETYASLTIPVDCPDNSFIRFEWNEKGGERATKTVPYRHTDNLIFGNFDQDLGAWDGNTTYLTDGTGDDDPQSLGYRFWRFTLTQNAWDYYGIGWWMQWKENWGDITEHPENYYFVFEVCTAATCPFYDYGENGTDGAKNGGYNFSINGGANYQWDPVYNGLVNTNGKWVTVRIPLDALTDPSKGLPTPGNGGNLAFICQPNNNDGWDKVDHSFGQFRFEKKVY